MTALDRYRPLAEASASRWSRALSVALPVELVMAVMRQENPRGDTLAVTREKDGAISRGLMQVKEATARDLGLTDPMALHVPKIGIDVGTKYLGTQLERYHGNVANAVAAYNSGTARFNQDETFINQRYVDRVLGFFRSAAKGAGSIGYGGWLLGGLAIAAIVAGRRSRERRDVAW